MNAYQTYLQARSDYELLVQEYNVRRRQLVTLRDEVGKAHHHMDVTLRLYKEELKAKGLDHHENDDHANKD